ncbi:hypothetical protein KAU37_06360 [Candidatus Bipolaricaulota bacterium]|nr:hypothetical protein [Candidatus Bipolaricaulota bacterium]
MVLTARTQELLEKVLAVLPTAEDEVITKGITSSVADRILELKRSAHRLKETYGSVEKLEKRIEEESVSADDHTLYNDLLEWRATLDELDKLLQILESL